MIVRWRVSVYLSASGVCLWVFYVSWCICGCISLCMPTRNPSPPPLPSPPLPTSPWISLSQTSNPPYYYNLPHQFNTSFPYLATNPHFIPFTLPPSPPLTSYSPTSPQTPTLFPSLCHHQHLIPLPRHKPPLYSLHFATIPTINTLFPYLATNPHFIPFTLPPSPPSTHYSLTWPPYLDLNSTFAAGLPESNLKSFDKTDEGLYKVTLKYPDYFPCQKFVRNPAIRAKLEVAFNSRFVEREGGGVGDDGGREE